MFGTPVAFSIAMTPRLSASIILGILFGLAVGCGGATSKRSTGYPPETGGAAATGGIAATGGVADTGGTAGGLGATGGISDTGEMAVTGGSPGTGGIAATGGSPGTGGIAATGGLPGLGGIANAGGTPGTGGTTSTGGASASACPAMGRDFGCLVVPDGLECTYPTGESCTNGAVPKAVYWCENGTATHMPDLGCGPGELAESCTGSCSTANARSRYLAERCTANQDLFGQCTCANGAWSSCSREYDCYPPSTCVTPAGDCWSTGAQSTSPSSTCPAGSSTAACTGRLCKPGDARPRCEAAGHATHSAVCIYGQWACPAGYIGPTLL